nr:hypothetical protein HDNAPKKO_00011 [Cydia pomonella granulovirus]WOZ45578.1 hypothetical protein AAGMHLIN_00007 [Cydia pomonella granulovirus]WOZ45983.1 hypothetical protein JPLFIAAO_00010 [Cydia pomonella granulovirus]WOZ46259.1 hypothetical protein MEFDCDFN_00010 [Cydia pomonella granulovirus]WOZ46396.1 hypothetical protein JEKDHOOB_00010 [Cydia pomonella granulovirus]
MTIKIRKTAHHISTMNVYNLIHETNFYSLGAILKSGLIFTSSKTQKIKEVLGQGSKNRRLTTDPTVSLYQPDFYLMYDEVDGVYMRLQPKTESLPILRLCNVV